MNVKSVVLGAAIAVVAVVVVTLCVGSPKVLVEAPVTNSYTITNNVNNVTPITNSYSITNSVSHVAPITNTYSITNNVNNLTPITNTYSITNNFAMPDGLVPAKPLPSEIEISKRDAMAALFAINHINWVITKIKTYNDPAVLEEEYKGLTADALDLRVIRDPELIVLIRRILDTIVQLRIDEKEREMLKDELDQGMSDALVEAISGFSVSGLNPLQMAVSAVTSAVTAGMNYRKIKRKLQAQFKKQVWSLDKSKMLYLNDLNKDILSSFWAIVQKYPDIDDKYRVAEQDIQMLVDHLKDEDAEKRHEFLVALASRFAAFQPYWYHRAVAAYEVACNIEKELRGKASHGGQGKSMQEITSEEEEKDMNEKKRVMDSAWKDAKASLDTYLRWQLECGNILRRDPTAAKAAILKSCVLYHYGSLKDNDPQKINVKTNEYLEIIKLVDKNTSPADWQSRYVCAMLAKREVNDLELAEQVIAPAIAELDWQRRRRLVEWTEEASSYFETGSTNAITSVLATGDALYECKTLLIEIGELSESNCIERVSKLCDDQYASVREKMFCFGALGYEHVLKKLRPDIAKMRVAKVSLKNGGTGYGVFLPFSWVIARDPSMDLIVGDSKLRAHEECSLKERPDIGQCVSINFEVRDSNGSVDNVQGKIRFRSRFERVGTDVNNKRIKKHYMVEVYFRPSGGEWIPNEARFGEWRTGTIESDAGWAGSYKSEKF